MKYPASLQRSPAQMQIEVPQAHEPRTGWLANILRDRVVQIGVAAWILFSIAIPLLATGTVPFDQPDLARVPYSWRVWGEITGPIFALMLIGVIFALTHGRSVESLVCSPQMLPAFQ